VWLGALGGCNGCGIPTVTAVKCKTGDCCHTDADCVTYEKGIGSKDPTNYFCLTATETCELIKKPCTDDGQCCPGQTCGELGLCQDSYNMCGSNMDCNQGAGQYCDPKLGIFSQGMGCTFNTCNAANGNADCATGLTCFNSYCLDQPPCNGGCPSGEVCTPVNNFCFKLDNPSATCSQTCQAGYLLVFQDGTNVFNECNLAGKQDCTCAVLPPIQANNIALFSSAASAGSNILVSAYDYDFGDLVLHTFDKQSLLQTNVEWVDGVPSMGPITGDPSGPRGGSAVPGPDVGRYTSIAYDASNDTTHIAYYAVADGMTVLQDLRYAWRQGSTGPWTIVTVDGHDAAGNKTGDVGKYASIALSPDHAPVISYFQEGPLGANQNTTAIKVARGTKPQPTEQSQFIISTIETQTLTLPDCEFAPCTSSQTCVATSSAPGGLCVTNDSLTACPPTAAEVDAGQNTSCGSGDICGTPSGGSPACYTPATAPSLDDLPSGDGLFTSIAYLDNVPVIVWYDRTTIPSTTGILKGIIAHGDSAQQGVSTNPSDIVVLDDGTGFPGGTHDVGRYANVAVGPSTAPHRIAVGYVDNTTLQLDLITADAGWTNVTPAGATRVVDSGVGTPTKDPVLFVGSDVSVQFVGNNIEMVYQDQTGGTLRFAKQPSPSAPVAYVSTLASTGAGGFSSKLVYDGTNAYASHAIIKALSPTLSGNQLNVVAVP
jgi:hypothetical protein